MPQYRVTDLAPRRIAGRRVRPGDVIEIAPELVRYEIDHQQLKPVEAEAPPPQTEDGTGAPMVAVPVGADGVGELHEPVEHVEPEV